MTNAPRPGWYPDPAGTDLYRWWDGRGWTDEVSPSPHAPTPPGSAAAAASAGGDPPRRRSPLRAVVALVVILALFLSATLGFGLWLWGDSSSSRSEARATPAAGPRGQLEESSRTASIGAVTMQLPGDPYELVADPVSVRDVFDAAFVAEAKVHEQYDGEHDWAAMVALTALDSDLADGSDTGAAGRAALDKIARRMYAGQHTDISDIRLAERSIDGSSGVEVGARIHYAVDRLASRYDTVTAVVVRLDDGTMVAALSSVPDDADSAVKRLAQASLDSLAIN